MAVRLTEPFGCYWNHGVQQLAQGDTVPSGEFANYLLATGAPVQEVEDGPAVDGDGVPDATIAQVMEWVGGDPDRAAKALDAENAKGDKARATLVAALEKLTEPA